MFPANHSSNCICFELHNFFYIIFILVVTSKDLKNYYIAVLLGYNYIVNKILYYIYNINTIYFNILNIIQFTYKKLICIFY